jgi:hypothetical protein
VRENSSPAVTFCDLVSNPEPYNGKEVTVRAGYKYGFEWSYLYCLTCKDRVWLEFPNGLDDSATKAMKHAPKVAGHLHKVRPLWTPTWVSVQLRRKKGE